jgi:hypothetical protein
MYIASFNLLGVFIISAENEQIDRTFLLGTSSLEEYL